ncbi:MAG: ligase-associated DNA damage response exonuclease [Steroidobacteraceae bacterium]|jgi:putative mRNA 3-end processing factor|nr:ligase-associated DNA damage response exonuclease [Steroidobacteraceae bacterium]
MALITVTAGGLYCPAGDFYIDPWRPAPRAVITHAHGDHLRGGSERYVVSRPGMGLARRRLPPDAEVQAVDYGEPVAFGDVRVSLHPAGHVLGSAQVRIEHDGEVWVVSGDYKRDPDPTCAPFEVVPCDVFISEATFALPVYRWTPTAAVAAEIHAWWMANRERGLASVLFAYALGKAQRVLAELAALTHEPVYVHGAVASLVESYREAGVAMLPTLAPEATRRAGYAGALVLAPPSASGSPWMRRFGEAATGFCSGWMRVRGDRRRRGYDRGFVLSDHADWPSLLRTFRDTGARRILLTHGHTETMCRYLREQGIDAAALATDYGAEDA